MLVNRTRIGMKKSAENHKREPGRKCLMWRFRQKGSLADLNYNPSSNKVGPPCLREGNQHKAGDP